MIKITNVLPTILEPEDNSDELAIYLTKHIDEYYKFKENHKKASFWFGRRGHVFHIKAEADQIKPWFSTPDLFSISRQVVDDSEFSRWEVYIEELIHDVHLAPFIVTHGVMPTWSKIFPMKQIKQFVYNISLETGDFYA